MNEKDEPLIPKPAKQDYRIVVQLTAPMQELLGELVTSGLYGANLADAARRLIERGLEDYLASQPGE